MLHTHPAFTSLIHLQQQLCNHPESAIGAVRVKHHTKAMPQFWEMPGFHNQSMLHYCSSLHREISMYMLKPNMSGCKFCAECQPAPLTHITVRTKNGSGHEGNANVCQVSLVHQEISHNNANISCPNGGEDTDGP